MILTIDRVLNRITMYRLVLDYTTVLLGITFVLGFTGLVPQDPTALTFSFAVIFGTCWLTNKLFADFLRVPTNAESYLITAVILALIMQPVTAHDLAGVAGLILAAVAAIASKFIITIRRRHLYNPVAVGVVTSALVLGQPATWWIGGNPLLLPVVIAGGLLVAHKVQRLDMLGAYVCANLAAMAVTTPPSMYASGLKATIIYSPLLFAGFAMLTEPLTAAHGRLSRLAYGAIVGALCAPNVHIGSLYLTPEMAFLVGNLFAWASSPEGRFRLTLLRAEKAAADCYDFVFRSDKPFNFRAGQYLDWTLPVAKPDNRGNRRPFTLASAPTETELRIGVKFYEGPSAFKLALASMKPGEVVYASQIAGTFTLPKDTRRKLAFIAGGIGVTPFRSMIQELIDRRERRSIVMLYGNNKLADIAYGDIFERATQELGVRVVYAVAQPEVPGCAVHEGIIDEALIQRCIPDYLERTFYLSGPRAMVVRFESSLKQLGVPRSGIRVDFFPGFA
jgi:ferredoxin-NADP reductase